MEKEQITLEDDIFQPNLKWEDKLVKGYYINAFSELRHHEPAKGLTSNRNTFPSKEEALASVALAQLCQWRDEYNGEPLDTWADFTDEKQLKFVIYFFNEEINLASMPIWGTRRVLCFKTQSILEKFYKDFEELIITAKPLL